MKQQQGFTLVEMIVVIAIIGVMMAFSIPNFTLAKRQGQVQAVQRELASDLRLAQTTTLSQHVDPAHPNNTNSMGLSIHRDGYVVFYGDGTTPYDPLNTNFTVVKTKTALDIQPSYISSLQPNAAVTLYFRPTRDAGGDVGTLLCIGSQCGGGPDTIVTISSDQVPGFDKNIIIKSTGLIRVEQ
jgi:prepilin-type N-terminal cleavage/methylation domain-containing protein